MTTTCTPRATTLWTTIVVAIIVGCLFFSPLSIFTSSADVDSEMLKMWLWCLRDRRSTIQDPVLGPYSSSEEKSKIMHCRDMHRYHTAIYDSTGRLSIDYVKALKVLYRKNQTAIDIHKCILLPETHDFCLVLRFSGCGAGSFSSRIGGEKERGLGEQLDDIETTSKPCIITMSTIYTANIMFNPIHTAETNSPFLHSIAFITKFSMLFPLHLYFVLAILIHIGALEMGLTTQDPVPPLLVTRLIHDHSVNSPYFDPKKTIKELADIDLQSSISSAKYLISNTSVSSYLTDIESQLTPKLQRVALPYANGVLGLGASVLSLITQLQYSKFSYCIGNISDRSYPYNTLVIGDRIELIGYKTPMIIEHKYYINLESIKIGNKLLDIDSEIFRRKPDYNGGMVLDTGSTYSFIPQVALDQFEGETGKLIDLLLVRNSSIKYREYTRLCYNGVLTRDLTGFPTVQFQFQGDATMELTDENIFQQTYDGTFCLAILPSETLGTSISLLGNLMQQYFYIAYDLRDKKLSFQRMDCNTVDDYIHDEL
ncbi:UNVERIFIED_CONTAM: Aspartic proteinase nepenthesin-2 [Sesamum calycinum]|uniref:Aspartic proteinase nepenthesin-2 n=1 Tax=Sesamum calycinum TaxID=2727403 RepID=A0AAW2RSW1_9LAMI